jgi:hypothetical protein
MGKSACNVYEGVCTTLLFLGKEFIKISLYL